VSFDNYIPAYFLGDLSRDQIEDCEKMGAHGIAGITATKLFFWFCIGRL